MTDRDEERDGLASTLSLLQTHAPDPVRAALGLARARAQMTKAATRGRGAVSAPARGRVTPRGDRRSALEPALVGGVCVVFLFEVLSRAHHLYQGAGTNY